MIRYYICLKFGLYDAPEVWGCELARKMCPHGRIEKLKFLKRYAWKEVRLSLKKNDERYAALNQLLFEENFALLDDCLDRLGLDG